MSWIEKVMGKGSIMEIYNKVLITLEKEAKNLGADLPNLINVEMI